MKYLKKFELIDHNNKPEKYDYVIVNRNSTNTEYKHFLENNIGKIVDIDIYNFNISPDYTVRYYNIPERLKGHFDCRGEGLYEGNEHTGIEIFDAENIIHWSDNKEELELYIQANKYNL